MFQGNKAVVRRETEKQREKHEKRLKSMKSVIDSTTPHSLIKRIPRGKKLQLLEERCTEIERENRILYEKMLKIRNKTPPPLPPSSKKSLNQTFRKLQLEEIEKANSNLIQRIQRKESSYKLEKFHTERRDTERILSNISEFPSQSIKRKQSTGISSGKKTPRKLDPIKKCLIHRQGKIFNNKSFLIEIYKNSDNYRITAFDLDSPDKYTIHLGIEEFAQMSEECGDLKKIVSALEIEEGNLVIKHFEWMDGRY
ncbi:hypothetical protein SteCoe_19116 [Stentor coeruleus]|uniref:Uncharacterized protein n=1 Tax=Stentor coeruleus TaxID=5963 RepID=A0A1R2BUZ6_9CILI|nr:hypothetical protein SteCoe_19116 [Stentor coeruleus]